MMNQTHPPLPALRDLGPYEEDRQLNGWCLLHEPLAGHGCSLLGPPLRQEASGLPLGLCFRETVHHTGPVTVLSVLAATSSHTASPFLSSLACEGRQTSVQSACTGASGARHYGRKEKRRLFPYLRRRQESFPIHQGSNGVQGNGEKWQMHSQTFLPPRGARRPMA